MEKDDRKAALDFLLFSCQSSPNLGEAIPLLERVQNRQILIQSAFRHGTLPLLYRTLKNLQEHSLLPLNDPSTETFLRDLNYHYLSIARQNMLMSAELIHFIQLFKMHKIDVLAFKGPTLSQLAYGDITLRHYGDLDILVHKKDFRKIATLMRERGYSSRYPIETFIGDKVMFEMNNDCPFYDRERGLSIEIHWDFFRKLALSTEVFSPWENTETVTINGRNIQTLSRETHLLYHSLHGAKHIWERLIWIVDIDRLIRNTSDLDWERIITMAKKTGAEKMFFSGLALAHRYLHTPLPTSILHRCGEFKFEAFITHVESELIRSDPASEESLAKLFHVIALRDNFYYGTKTFFEFLFRPGINERRSIILPDSLFGLYWIIRPFGIAYRFIFCRIMKLCK